MASLHQRSFAEVGSVFSLGFGMPGRAVGIEGSSKTVFVKLDNLQNKKRKPKKEYSESTVLSEITFLKNEFGERRPPRSGCWRVTVSFDRIPKTSRDVLVVPQQGRFLAAIPKHPIWIKSIPAFKNPRDRFGPGGTFLRSRPKTYPAVVR